MSEMYTLMNKNIRVCDFEINKYNEILSIQKIYNQDYAPVEIINFNEISLNRLIQWFTGRAIPVERDGFDEIIKNLQLKDNKEYLIKNLALSLSDQYWIKPINEDIYWDQINFYENNYNAIAFCNATFGKENNVSSLIKEIHTSQMFTPNASLGGMLKKLWLQFETENYLIKGSNTLHHLEPVHEVLASKICAILNVDHVDYQLMEIKGKRINQLVSVCKGIVDSNEHIVSAYSLVLGFPEARIKDYPSYINFVVNELGISSANEEIQKMLMLDYIMLNEDRHLNNFGVIRNSDNLKWERICPIYDTGKSLNTAINEDYWEFSDGEIKPFEGGVDNQDYLMELIDISLKSHVFKELYLLADEYNQVLLKYQNTLNVKDESIIKLTNGYIERVKTFENAMREKNLVIDD